MELNNIAVFISGRGSNLLSLLKKEKENKLKANIKLIYSNKKNAPGLKYAKKYDKKTIIFPYKSKNESKLLNILKKEKINLIVLAGFMKILSENFIKKFKNPIVNIHPSLLPSFKGINAQRQAFDAGVKFSGITIHFVDTSLDGGPIIFQKPIYIGDISSAEEVSKRILRYEHRYYYQIVNKLATCNWKINNKKVIFYE